MAFNHTYNQNNVETDRGGNPPALPAGEYTVQIVKSTDRISQKSGKDMIELELEVIQPTQYAGRKLWVYIVDDQYADQKIYDIFRSAGKPVPQQVHSGVFLNLVGKVKTKQRVYNGETRSEVNYWIPKKIDADTAAAVAAEVAGVKTDDIPF